MEGHAVQHGSLLVNLFDHLLFGASYDCIFKDAMSDFRPIWPQNLDLKLNRYFDGGRESYKLLFVPLLEKSAKY